MGSPPSLCAWHTESLWSTSLAAKHISMLAGAGKPMMQLRTPVPRKSLLQPCLTGSQGITTTWSERGWHRLSPQTPGSIVTATREHQGEGSSHLTGGDNAHLALGHMGRELGSHHLNAPTFQPVPKTRSCLVPAGGVLTFSLEMTATHKWNQGYRAEQLVIKGHNRSHRRAWGMRETERGTRRGQIGPEPSSTGRGGRGPSHPPSLGE